MNYTEALSILPHSTYFYAGISQADIDAVTVEKYVTKKDDELLLGTLEPIKKLAKYEIQPGKINFN